MQDFADALKSGVLALKRRETKSREETSSRHSNNNQNAEIPPQNRQQIQAEDKVKLIPATSDPNLLTGMQSTNFGFNIFSRTKTQNVKLKDVIDSEEELQDITKDKGKLLRRNKSMKHDLGAPSKCLALSETQLSVSSKPMNQSNKKIVSTEIVVKAKKFPSLNFDVPLSRRQTAKQHHPDAPVTSINPKKTTKYRLKINLEPEVEIDTAPLEDFFTSQSVDIFIGESGNSFKISNALKAGEMFEPVLSNEISNSIMSTNSKNSTKNSPSISEMRFNNGESDDDYVETRKSSTLICIQSNLKTIDESITSEIDMQNTIIEISSYNQDLRESTNDSKAAIEDKQNDIQFEGESRSETLNSQSFEKIERETRVPMLFVNHLPTEIPNSFPAVSDPSNLSVPAYKTEVSVDEKSRVIKNMVEDHQKETINNTPLLINTGNTAKPILSRRVTNIDHITKNISKQDDAEKIPRKEIMLMECNAEQLNSNSYSLGKIIRGKTLSNISKPERLISADNIKKQNLNSPNVNTIRPVDASEKLVNVKERLKFFESQMT